MKIAFVGKGGSGKSTISALFIQYLKTVKHQHVLALDADLNMNLAGLLGVKANPEHLLANPQVQNELRTYLRGHNARIADASKFLPTTPPGEGSNIIRSVDDRAIGLFAARVSEVPSVRLLTVGSYGKEEIGQACYHTHLFMAENILSHTMLAQDSHVVSDMVAGTDAFAYSLHLQFDAIILIAEPTPESTQVCNDYRILAKEAGVDSLIHLIANKVEDQADIAYIHDRTGIDPVCTLPFMSAFKKARQQGQGIPVLSSDDRLMEAMISIEAAGLSPRIKPVERMRMLCTLHEKLMRQDWVKSGYGDLSGQIDETFLKKAG